MSKYVIGDIHGEVTKLIECLELVNFDCKNDVLIQLGDVVDRGESSFECVEELLKIDHLIALKGNHDSCFYNGLIDGNQMLYTQGAMETLRSYIRNCSTEIKLCTATKFRFKDIPSSHQVFFENQLPYYIDKDNNLFVHGGFNRHKLVKDEHDEEVFYWDRDLLASARSYSSMKDKAYPFKTKDEFKEIFLGHTPVQSLKNTNKPLKFANINLLDTGCGKGNFPLTIMNLETREIFQSQL